MGASPDSSAGPSQGVGAIIVAAGTGQRMGQDKVFVRLLGRPLVWYTLYPFVHREAIGQIVLVLSAEKLAQGEAMLAEQGWAERVVTCTGGPRRQDSVRCGLEQLRPCKWVLVHDGARPLVDEALIRRGLEAATGGSAAVAAVPVSDTIKVVDEAGLVVETLERRRLWAVQTPQVFSYALLREAHRRVMEDVTDDAAMVECLGLPVRVFPGEPANIKVTTPEDLMLAELLLRRRLELQGISR